METTDIIVIGSEIGGLSCAALLARYGFKVIVCESHSLAGGAAHAFNYKGFKFDSGPSLSQHGEMLKVLGCYILVLDENGVIMQTNPAAKKIFQLKKCLVWVNWWRVSLTKSTIR